MKRDEIAQMLPAVFQRTLAEGGPLSALLEVMEVLHAPSEAVLGRLDAIFDPRRTDDQFVPYLAYWADLTRLFDESVNSRNQFAFSRSSLASGMGRLRELIGSAAYLSQWRGTKKGLLLFLQTATGLAGFEVHENVSIDGQPKPFHISVRAPKDSAQYQELIERIVDLEKPAYVTSEISFESAAGK